MTAWDVWAVLGTEGVGAFVALFVDFFLKPRLQVRNERFSRRAKDLLDLLDGVRSMLLDAAQLNDQSSDDAEFLRRYEDRRKMIRDRLLDKAESSQDVYGPAAHHLHPAIGQYVQQCVGLTIGACMSEHAHGAVHAFLEPRLGLAYEALYTPKTKFIGYRLQL
ncbi:hypothetical protein [Arthrobacter sp. NA-172]|uniref:hypothetical protein n=1 Tax=Arthrobacter sp. NA-172 TaxID=3367524 RepID=UPI003754F7E8